VRPIDSERILIEGKCSLDGSLFQDGRIDVFEFRADTRNGEEARLLGVLHSSMKVAVPADKPGAVDVGQRMREPHGDFETSADWAGDGFYVARLYFIQQTQM
jgi:hypothetical protein